MPAIRLILDNRPDAPRLGTGDAAKPILPSSPLGRPVLFALMFSQAVAAIHRTPDAAFLAARGNLPEIAISFPERGVDDARIIACRW